MKKIMIENIKNIGKLTFTMPETNDLYLLVGPNGIGKTTLLVCLDRLCHTLAFSNGFPATKQSNEIDRYENAEITYETDTVRVRFRKKTAKWVPTPKKGSSELLSSFGFSNTVFIKADSSRIDITQAEIKNGIFENANRTIIETMNRLFETHKYSRLKRLRNSNGRGRQATYFYVIKDGDRYYSEKRFSTGEIAVLRLVELLLNAQENSMFLIDEAEMALHPRVQRNLITYLKEQSQAKNIMIFVSTHSVPLIKATRPENIYLLEEINNTIQSTTPCYPARAIGDIDCIENAINDIVFFVEDDMAQLLLKKMIIRYLRLEPELNTMMYDIIPVGGYRETAKFAINASCRLLYQSKVFAVLDADAFIEGQADSQFWTLYQQNQDTIRDLSCTPEVWLIDKLESADRELANTIRIKYRCEVSTIIQSIEYTSCVSPKPRKLAKKKMDVIVAKIKQFTGENEYLIRDSFVESIVATMNDGEIRRAIAPMMR